MIRLIHKADFFVLINRRCTGTMVPGAYVPRGTSRLVPRPGYGNQSQKAVSHHPKKTDSGEGNNAFVLLSQQSVLPGIRRGRFPQTLNRVEGNRHPCKCRIKLPTSSGMTVPIARRLNPICFAYHTLLFMSRRANRNRPRRASQNCHRNELFPTANEIRFCWCKKRISQTSV